ncbi:MAG: hypothetical protein KIT63_02575 [Rhodoferax sp.]|nr:hypothetical protein [Rhodoferax sp.]
MIFDQKTGSLFADDGRFMKSVRCPLALRSEQLSLSVDGSPDRFCHACNKAIRYVDEWTDEQMRSAMEEDRNLCLFATPKAKHIVFLSSPGVDSSYEDVVHLEGKDLVRIQTMRSLEAMSDAIERGFHLVFGDTGVDNKYGDVKYVVYRNRATGRLLWSSDFRDMISLSDLQREEDSNSLEVLKEWFWVRADRPFPMAAYAVPKDLAKGSRVYLEDLIEDVLQESWNQGNSIRLNAWSATWNGSNFDVDAPLDMGIMG